MNISIISSGVMPTFRALRTCTRTCVVASWTAETVNVAIARYLMSRPGRLQMEPYRLSVIIRYISGASSYATGAEPMNSLPSPPARRDQISKPFWNRSSKVAITLPFSTVFFSWGGASRDDVSPWWYAALGFRFHHLYHGPCRLFIAIPERINFFILRPFVGQI